MGYDIHLYAEVKEDGVWKLADPPVTDWLYDYEVEELERWKRAGPDRSPEPPEVTTPALAPKDLDLNRVRPLFGILGDLQVDGCSAAPYVSITSRRGVPADASALLREWHAYLGEDAQAPSWIYLDEFLAFDWHGQIIQRKAMVDSRVAHLFNGNPLGFPFARWPAGVPVTYCADMRDGVPVQWRQTYAEAAEYDIVRERLVAYDRGHGSRTVRFIFWFSC